MGGGALLSVYDRARAVMPGGVNSPVRAMRQIGREPIFIERGEGVELVDVEGNRYIDWVCSWGPLILGHADPAVVSAVIAASERGTSYGAATAVEVELAEQVRRAVPSVEMLQDGRLGHRGGDGAVALPRSPGARLWSVRRRLPRPLRRPAGRGRRLGVGDPCRSLAARGSPPASGGADVMVPWNGSPFAVERALAEHEVAALLAEPLAANMGIVPPADGFLEFLRTATRAAGTQLMSSTR